jgi:hypothetical protein
MKLLPSLLVGAICALLAPASHGDSVLMFDFGPTPVPEASGTNSPYHTVNPSFTDKVWNMIEQGGGFGTGLTGFSYSDGTAADGVLLYRGSGSTTSVDWQAQIWNSLVGGGTGILADDSVGRDAIYGPAVTNAVVGVKIQGLTIGQAYDVYVVGWNTAGNDPRSFYIGLTVTGQTGSARNMSLDGFVSASATNDLTTNVTSWVQGENYVKFTITPTEETPAVAILSGVGSGGRAYLNAIQIVAVPEPGACMLLLVSVAALLKRKRPARA